MYVSSYTMQRVCVFTLRDGRFVRFVGDAKCARGGRGGEEPGQFRRPCSVVIHADEVFVLCWAPGTVEVFGRRDGAFRRRFGGSGRRAQQMHLPNSMCIDGVSGEVFVADTGNYRVQVWSRDGTWLRCISCRKAVDPRERPFGVAVMHARDELFVVQQSAAGYLSVFRASTGEPLRQYSREHACRMEMSQLSQLSLRVHSGVVMLTETDLHSVFVLDAVSGTQLACIGSDELHQPSDSTLCDGRLYVVSNGDRRRIDVFRGFAAASRL